MKTKHEFKISSKLLKEKYIEVKLNKKAYNLISQICSFTALQGPLEAAKEPSSDQHHYIRINRRQVSEMRQLVKQALSYIKQKTLSKTKCCFWTITERSLKYTLKHLH